MLSDNDYRPEELKAALNKFVYTHNNECYHESLQKITLADIYFGRGDQILKEREKIKKQCLAERRQEYRKNKSTELAIFKQNPITSNYVKHELVKCPLGFDDVQTTAIIPKRLLYSRL